MTAPKIIITLTQTTLKAYAVSFGKTAVEKKLLFESPYTQETATQVMQSAAKKLPKKTIRLLLPEDKTYLALISIPKLSEISREIMLHKAQEIIPELIEDQLFDWKKVHETQELLYIQLLTVSKEFFTPLAQALTKANLTVEAYETPSLALARVTAKEKEAHLLLYTVDKDTTILCTAFQGTVYESITTDTVNAKLQEKLKKHTQETWGIEITQTITDKFPEEGTAQKEDLQGKDVETLNIHPAIESFHELLKEEKAPLEIKGEEPTPPKQTKKISLWIGIGIMIVAVLAGIVGATLFFLQRVEQKASTSTIVLETPSTQQEATISATPITEEVATPSAFPKEKLNLYSIEVQNGSTLSGEAKRIGTLLSEKGFTVSKMTNADASTYVHTVIQSKKTVESGFLDLLDKELSALYSDIQREVLADTVRTDVIIIIGRK